MSNGHHVVVAAGVRRKWECVRPPSGTLVVLNERLIKWVFCSKLYIIIKLCVVIVSFVSSAQQTSRARQLNAHAVRGFFLRSRSPVLSFFSPSLLSRRYNDTLPSWISVVDVPPSPWLSLPYAGSQWYSV